MAERGSGMTRRGFVKAGMAAAAVMGIGGMRSRAAQTPSSIDEILLDDAPARIERHRTSPGTVIVIGPDGRPVRDARIRVEQTRHEFLFGANFFLFGRLSDSELESEYRERYAALLNAATLGFYWSSFERERGRPDYAYIDSAVDWCRQRGIVCKGHPLAWDARETSPNWVGEGEDIAPLSLARVREITERYKGRIDLWDVVNEPSHAGLIKSPLGLWAGQVGAVRYVADHLRAAREGNRSARLLVNDYRVGERFLGILKALQEEGGPLFDAIGIQSHMHIGVWPLYHVWSVCEQFGALGFPVHFTETTILSGPRVGWEEWDPTTPEGEAEQAHHVERLYTMLFSHPSVEAAVWWDFSDLGAWKGAPAGWLRPDMSPKPAYDRLHSLIKGKWWTRAAGRTGVWGEFSTRAFHGNHRITATLPNGVSRSREVQWRRGKPNRHVIHIH